MGTTTGRAARCWRAKRDRARILRGLAVLALVQGACERRQPIFIEIALDGDVTRRPPDPPAPREPAPPDAMASTDGPDLPAPPDAMPPPPDVGPDDPSRSASDAVPVPDTAAAIDPPPAAPDAAAADAPAALLDTATSTDAPAALLDTATSTDAPAALLDAATSTDAPQAPPDTATSTDVPAISDAAPPPDGPAARILYVGGRFAPSRGDQMLLPRLRRRFAVTFVPWDMARAADADGQDLVFIADSVDSGTIGATFRDTPVPVVVSDSYVYSAMMMAGQGFNQGYFIGITAPGHPLAGGLSGSVAVYGAPTHFMFGTPAPSAVVVAYTASTALQPAIFAYRKGDEMRSAFVAPAKRVGWFCSDPGALVITESGLALLDAAVAWALAP